MSPLEIAPTVAAAEKPKRKPLDPAKRAAAVQRQQVKRALRKLESARSVDELQGLLGQVPSAAPPATSPAPPAASSSSTPIAGVQRMPSKEAIDAALPNVSEMWATVAETLKGTPLELDERKIATLARGTAPLFIQHVETLTPKALFVGTLALVFGRPLMEMAASYVQGWWTKRKPPPVAPAAIELGDSA